MSDQRKTERSCIFYDHRNMPCCTECGSDLSLCQCADPDYAANQRLNSIDGQLVTMILNDLETIRVESTQSHLLASISAAVGQLSNNMIRHDRQMGPSAHEVLRDLVHVAALTIRLAADGDDNFLYEYPIVEEDLPTGPKGGQYD